MSTMLETLSTTHTLTGRVRQARKGKSIIDATNGELAEAIAYVSMLGNYLVPTNEQFAILCQFLKTNFAYFTTQEIVIAFECAITTEMKVDLKFVRGGTLSSVEFGAILNKYKEYRLQHMNAIDGQNLLPEKVLTEDDKRNISIVSTCDTFDRYATRKPVVLHWSHYKFLQREKVISFEGDNIVARFENDQYERIGSVADVMFKATQIIADELESRKARAISRSERNDAQKRLDDFMNTLDPTNEKNRAREITLKIYFDELIERKINISQIIKSNKQ